VSLLNFLSQILNENLLKLFWLQDSLNIILFWLRLNLREKMMREREVEKLVINEMIFEG